MATSSRFRAYAALVLFLTMVPTAQAKYSGGTGEPNDPYQIATAADLITLGETPEDYDKHFILTADIDLVGHVFDKAVIAPDTDSNTELLFVGTAFTGVFDGDGHTVSHLTITGVSWLGLFGQLGEDNIMRRAEVKDLGVVDANITSSGYEVGGLLGLNYGGALTNCNSTGAVRSTGSQVGGLAGGNSGTMIQCCSAAVVTAGDCTGGLVGRNSGSVTQSYSTGVINGNDVVGGLVGSNIGGTLTACYSTGTVSGSTVGGLVGTNVFCWAIDSCRSGSIANCYSAGLVTGDESGGGLVGASYANDVVVSFWDIQTSGQTTSDGGTGKTTAEMQTAATFLDAGWDFVGETANGREDIWKIAEGLGYPRLAWEKYSGGTGEPNDPYQIATAADLIALGETPEDYDKHFILTADIDLDPNLPGGKVFDKAVIAPDLNETNESLEFDGTSFTGVLDGKGHTISHLTIKGKDFLGLFGQLASGGEAKDLGIVDANIVGAQDFVGGLVGRNQRAATHCYSTGTVNGRHYVGGLVGDNWGTVTECHTTGAVNGDCEVGGLVGENSGTVSRCHSMDTATRGVAAVGGLVGVNWGWNGPTVTQCYSTGAVDGNDVVGGLVGLNGGWRPTVAQCYSAGTVNGDTSVGGLVAANGGTVTQCYSTGAARGSEGFVGGLVGRDLLATLAGEMVGTATACFWDTQTSGQATSAGGMGSTTAEMQTAKTFVDAEWDFVDEAENGTEDIWWIDEGKDYPRLWWELINE